MKRVKIADLKDHLSKHLRAVERGATIEVTDRERPIVRLTPVEAGQRQLRIDPPRRSFAELRNRRFGKRGWRGSSLELLLEERGKR